jgi:tRNA threonylcarbamoyladenosine biosynthesis protein TsaE
MTQKTISEKQTRALGERIARRLKPGDIICLFGDLGAGKTVFTKGVARGLGIDPREVNSPSFILMHPYTTGNIPLYHFDFYRLKAGTQISDLGFEEFMYSDGVAVIEWPQRMDCFMPREYLEVKLQIVTQTSRRVGFRAHGKRYADLLTGYGKRP